MTRIQDFLRIPILSCAGRATPPEPPPKDNLTSVSASRQASRSPRNGASDRRASQRGGTDALSSCSGTSALGRVSRTGAELQRSRAAQLSMQAIQVRSANGFQLVLDLTLLNYVQFSCVFPRSRVQFKF
mmetsp:Transcript_55298/g.121181  ORF Transcript_55298/g.121181 Transcript_55298/m.121181 type:complete len:129 (-) Transcript_55298:74-460(-)